jgi:ketosteroid isomerase-like protein
LVKLSKISFSSKEDLNMPEQHRSKVPTNAAEANLCWFNALVAGDADALETLLADDFTFYHPFGGGGPDAKAGFVEGIKSGKAKYKNLKLEDTLIRSHGQTAIATGRLDILFQWESDPPIQERSFYTAVYGLYPSGWHMLAWHATTRADGQGSMAAGGGND